MFLKCYLYSQRNVVQLEQGSTNKSNLMFLLPILKIGKEQFLIAKLRLPGVLEIPELLGTPDILGIL